jgi:hypothetical protein
MIYSLHFYNCIINYLKNVKFFVFPKTSQKLLDTGRLCWYILGYRCLLVAGKPSKLLKSEREITMFVLPPNTILLICAAIVFAIVGYVIYGLVKGFENIFPKE